MNVKLQDCCSVCGSNSLCIACICNLEINSLCNSCISTHISNLNVSHNLVSIDLASSLISDPTKLEQYYEDISTAELINYMLNSKLLKLSRIRKTIAEAKQEMFTQLEGMFNDMLSKVEESYQDVSDKIKVVNQFKVKLSDEGMNMIELFRRKGDQEILEECLENVEIPVEEIMRKVKEMIRVQYPLKPRKKRKIGDEDNESIESLIRIPQPNMNIPENNTSISYPNAKINSYSSSYSPTEISSLSQEVLYIPKQESKYLMEFNLQSSTLRLLSFNSMDRNFNHTSTCHLPDGSILSAGYYNPVSNEVYLLNPHSQESRLLPSLSSPRYFLSLFYHSGYVYAFGGKNSENQILRTAERLKLSSSSWESLPDMKHSKDVISCICIQGRIYLFCGSNSTLDVFNTQTLEFEEVTIDNSEHGQCDGVAGIVGDEIYLQTSSLIQVYDLELNKRAQYNNSTQFSRFSLSNVMQYRDSIFYYNFYSEAIMEICKSNLDPITRSIGSNSRDTDNRYIYTANNGTYELLQLDLHTKTIQTFDLEPHLHSALQGTSICTLPNGQIFIAGFNNPVNGACYIYNPKTKACRRLMNMPTPRTSLSLAYCKGLIFAIGGEEKYHKTSKAFEKFDLANGKWKTLADILKPRIVPSCVVVENKIYIIGGSEGDIEIYDIKFHQHWSRKVKVHPFSVGFIINEQIYVIEDRHYKVFNLDLKKPEEIKIRNFECEVSFVLGNIVIYEDSVYFYNERIRMYEQFNFSSGERKALVVKSN